MKGPATTTIAERPPAGPARGQLAAPAWLVVLLSGLLAAVAVVSLVRRWRRRQV